MNDLTNTMATSDEDDVALIEIGDAATLTEGQGQGSSEDKRRAYNS
ncbi:albusnodin family lasso peptide [Kitasatospora sp. NPDC059795]